MMTERRTYPVPRRVQSRMPVPVRTANESTLRLLAESTDPEVALWACGVCDQIDRPPVLDGFGEVPGPYYGLVDPENEDEEVVVAIFSEGDFDDTEMQRWTGTGWVSVPPEYDPIDMPVVELPDDEATWYADPIGRGSRGVMLRPTSPRGFLPRGMAAAAPPEDDGGAVFAIVDDFDTTAVLDLVKVLAGPKVMVRTGGEWADSPETLTKLRSVDPPKVIRIPEVDVDGVMRQIDEHDAAKPPKPKPGAVGASAFALEAAANPPASTRMPDKLKQYWVHGEGAAKIRWGTSGDFKRCERQLARHLRPDQTAGACANLHKLATGTWPGKKTKHGATASGMEYVVTTYLEVDPLAGPDVVLSLVAGGALPPKSWFSDPGLDGPTPLTVTADGRVFGHIAAWNVHHIGMPGRVTPPKSSSGYQYFRTGVIETDGGEVPVGQLTLAGGHAPLSADASAAVAHYDNTASAVADIAAGEDQHGIWVSGSLRSGVTDDQIRALRASAPSGDWRPINGGLELVAICQVNVPGFPVARARVASGATMALVAAGARDMASRRYAGAMGLEDRLSALEGAAKAVLRQRVAVTR